MASLSCGCDFTQLIPRIRRADGTFIFPTVDPDTGVFTIDLTADLAAESLFAAIPGNGMVITPGGANGHTPTLAVCIDPASPIPLEFVNVGGSTCLRANEPAGFNPTWGSVGVVQAGGITVTPGGVLGHNPTFQIAIGPGQPFGLDAQGRLLFTGDPTGFSCADLAGCSINDLGDVTLNGAQADLHILYYDPVGGVWRNIFFPEFLALSLGVGGTSVPGVPLVGPPVELRYDPVTGTFGWQPA